MMAGKTAIIQRIFDLGHFISVFPSRTGRGFGKRSGIHCLWRHVLAGTPLNEQPSSSAGQRFV